MIPTLGWAGLYALRASVQAALYAGDHPELLAVAELSLGWPLTIATPAVSLAWLRHVEEHDPTTGKADGMTTWRAPARLSQSRN